MGKGLWARREAPWFRYLLPFVAILSAILLQFLLMLFVGKNSNFPFAFFYIIAVFATAWIGGAVPGVLACLVTVVGLSSMAPGGRLTREVWVRFAVFAGVSLLVSWVARLQRRMREKLSQANEQLDRRVAERTAELARAVALLEAEAEEHRKTEEALRRSEHRVDFTLDAAGIGRWDLDLATGRIARSPLHDRIFGYDAPAAEWKHELFLSHVLPEDRERAEEGYRAAIAGGGAFENELRITRRDGEIRWIAVQGKALLDERGQAVSLLGSVADVTRRKVAEQRLQTHLKRLSLLDHITRGIGEHQDLRSIFQVAIRSLEDNMPVDFACVCTYDQPSATLNVTCVGVNSAAFATELALTEQAIIDVGQNGLSRCVEGHVVYEPDVAVLDYPFPRRVARGGLRALVAAPLLIANQVFGVVIAARQRPESFASGDCEFLRQLSEHVALAANHAQIRSALQQAYDHLRSSQQTTMQQERLRALGQMASGIAHDINNAISPVALYTESLLENEPYLSPRTRQYLETTQRAIEDVAETVARMREFYRQHEPQLVLAPVQLGSLARQVLDLTRARWSDMAQRRGVTIQAVTDFAADLPPVPGIESEIREALTNLILNAADAMAKDGGTLTMRTGFSAGKGKLEPRVYIEVSDTGIGMDDDTRRRCLEPFFTTKGERGTGLGLAMVYGVVRRHDAEIEIESAPGQGTTARIVFPVADFAPGPAPEPLPAPAPSQARLRILVIDDDPLLIRSLRDTLEADGHQITTANGGSEGIGVFEASVNTGDRFSLVITDLGMPYVDGRTVARAVKAASRSTPVILLTGWGQRLVSDGDVPADVDRVLSKPPKLRDLRAALTALAPKTLPPVLACR
jgi:PAS domain S-box-containing protein